MGQVHTSALVGQSMTSPLTFFGGSTRVDLSPEAVAQIEAAAAAAHPRETAGPLFGVYTSSGDHGFLDVALVLEAPVAVRSSEACEVTTDGDLMTRMCVERWPDSHYLGEWHTHPYGSPDPSDQDFASMRQIASDPKTNCPEPVMVIRSPSGWSVHLVSTTRTLPFTHAPFRSRA